MTSFEQRGLAVCLVLAMALRGLVLWTHADELTRDRDAYLAIARNVVDGKGMVEPDRLTPTAYRPPLYPLQLAGLLCVAPAATAVAMGNLAWGVVAVWATWRAGHCLGLGSASLLAALLVAIDPLLLQYSAQPMTEVTCAGLTALLTLCIVHRDRDDRWRQFGTGIAFGGLVLCRPTFWPIVALLGAGWIVKSLVMTRGPIDPLRRPPLATLPWPAVLGTLLVVAPWVVRNQLVMGSPILMTTHGGYTLLLANNSEFYAEVVDRGWGSEWSQLSFDKWQADWQQRLALELGPDVSEAQRDSWQSLQARKYIGTVPGRFLQAVGFRIRALWSPFPQGETTVNPLLVQIVGGYYIVALLLFAAGMISESIWLVRARQFTWWPLIALVLTVQIVHLAYWTNARMRAPLVPIISLFAAAAVRRIGNPSRPAPPSCAAST